MTSGANFGSARSLVKSVSLVFSYALPDIHGRHLGLGKDAGRYRCRRAARSDRSGMLPQFIDEDPRVLAVGAAQRFDDVEVFFAWNAKDLLDTLILKGGDEQLGAFHGLQSSLGARSRLPNRRPAAGTRVGVRLMIEPKPCRQSDGTYGRASSRISNQILAGRSPMLFLSNDPMTRSNDRMTSHVHVGESASAS